MLAFWRKVEDALAERSDRLCVLVKVAAERGLQLPEGAEDDAG
jgi:hypothetical protein